MAADPTRAAFEAFYKERHPSASHARYGADEGFLAGQYVDAKQQGMWESWAEATRASVRPIASAPSAGTDAKREGQQRVAKKHTEELQRIRMGLAELYAKRQVTHGMDAAYVTADDAHSLMVRIWPDDATRPPATILSVVFTQRGWEWNNKLVKSTRESNHASDLRCWRWVGVEGARRSA